jgi:glycosyltransferase involved in cell wall biosynthesis
MNECAGTLIAGMSYFDEPEPRLAILGPPAITRRMFELWRTDRRVSALFDLKNPLHRRDYALWLGREGEALGLDRDSTAAALAIARRGSSLHRVPPRWPPQSAQPMSPAHRSVDAWLAEPIAWELGEHPDGIPMPRALALLWELRQDVRLHFSNRRRAEVGDYLAWCLTQGILDRCVDLALAEPGLAEFLDGLDPESARDSLPITRLLRIMAPLYDGPFPAIACEFPRHPHARFCVAIWACGPLRRRIGWPRSFVDRLLRWLWQLAPAADAFLPLDNLVFGLWKICPELQARGDLRTHEGRSALLAWFADTGVKQFELDDCISERLRACLPPVRHCSPQQAPAPARKRQVTRDLCLLGYADLVSGRAEDLHMSAFALRRNRCRWAMLDRLSATITTEDGQTAAAFADPPLINLVHLNADTAFFDYLFMREQGIERSYTIGYWAWELAKFPRQWNSSFAFVQEIWVSSRFAYDAIAPATTKPVFLMPPAVAVPPVEPGLTHADFGLPEDKFLFYFGFDFRSHTSRKNPLATVMAFRRAFPQKSTPVALLLKTIGSEWKSEERDRVVEMIRGDPRIVCIDGELSRPRAMALLALADCFVSLHRSEGFGRGPAEAMLLGKPVIITDYSGTSDYATQETALLIGYRLLPVGADEYPGAEGQFWADPDIDETAAVMRKIVADPSLAQRVGEAGRARIRALYDPSAVGARYVDRLAAVAKAI